MAGMIFQTRSSARANRIKPLTVLISVWTERQKNDIILKDLRVLRQFDLCPDDALARA